MDIHFFKNLIEEANILFSIKENPHPALKKRGLDIGFSGSYFFEDKEAEILIGVDGHFPNHKPDYFLLNQQEFGLLPHVEVDGFVCYTHDDTLVLDIDNPAGIIKESFMLAKGVIADGLSKKNWVDFFNEYEAYWRGIPGSQPILTNIKSGIAAQVIKIGKGQDYFFAVSDDAERINSIGRFIDIKNNPPQYVNGIYVPFKKAAEPFIPDGKGKLTIPILKDLVFKNITLENQTILLNILQKTRLEDFIIMDYLQPNGYHSIIGARLRGINYSRHPLISANTTASVTPLKTIRVDPEYLLNRGGNGRSYTGKKILVLGAGSVGGIVIEELTKSSVMDIDIVDRETLELENCYRHVCGNAYLNRNKAKALKAKIELFYPHSKINAFDQPIEDVIKKKKIQFDRYDAVIVATGNPTINQFLMDFFFHKIPGIPVIYSWLDPYGIGGHCLLSNFPGKGCYQCLYTNDQLQNTVSFADADQPRPFFKNISGCGNAYVPYGSLDASQTAILTLRKVLSIFDGNEKQNAVYSWKGDARIFLEEGYKLSSRYFQSLDELEAKKHLFYQDNCKVCG